MALTRRLLPEARRRWAIVAGLLFVLHPITAETVDNASFREDSLVTVFTLATLILALDRRPALALVAYGAGPPVEGVGGDGAGAAGDAAARAVRPRESPRLRGARAGRPAPLVARLRRLVVELIPYGVVTVVYLGIRFGPMKTPVAYARYPGGTFGDTLIGLPAIWAHDLRLLVWPWPLCADYTGYFRFGPQPWGPVLLAGGDRPRLPRRSSCSPFAAASGWSRSGSAGSCWRCSRSRTCSPSRSRPPSGSSTCRSAGSRSPRRRPVRAGSRERHPAPAAGGGGRCLGRGCWRRWRSAQPAPRRLARRPDALAGDRGGQPALLRRPERRGREPPVARDGRAAIPELLRASAAREELALAPLQRRERPVSGRLHLHPPGGGARAARRPGGGARGAGAGDRPPPALRPAVRLARLPGLPGGGPGGRSAMLLKKAIIDLGPPDATVAAVARYYVDKI